MIYKTCSIKRVIAKVFTDNALNEGDHRVSDMVEWASEGLEKIGAFPSFVNKVAGKDNVPLVVVSNYQARLPNDFHRLIQIAYSSNETGPFYPLRYATGSFEVSKQLNTDISSSTGTSTSNIVSDDTLITLIMDLYDLTYVQALSKLNTEPNVRSILEGLVGATRGGGESSSSTIDWVYVIHDGYVKLNVESGFLLIAYQAIPTDIDGYPLVPDEQSFLDALYWYITMKLYYPEWKQGRVRDEVYYDARRSWNYYCKQAYGNAMMPNIDQLESIKNSWLRLIPELSEHAGFFSTLGQEQKIYSHN
jgi:hypothetical protein